MAQQHIIFSTKCGHRLVVKRRNNVHGLYTVSQSYKESKNGNFFETQCSRLYMYVIADYLERLLRMSK